MQSHTHVDSGVSAPGYRLLSLLCAGRNESSLFRAEKEISLSHNFDRNTASCFSNPTEMEEKKTNTNIQMMSSHGNVFMATCSHVFAGSEEQTSGMFFFLDT